MFSLIVFTMAETMLIEYHSIFVCVCEPGESIQQFLKRCASMLLCMYMIDPRCTVGQSLHSLVCRGMPSFLCSLWTILIAELTNVQSCNILVQTAQLLACLLRVFETHCDCKSTAMPHVLRRHNKKLN